ncbi:unnamed protein product, partial [Discosporangium mesarthrocarpum]
MVAGIRDSAEEVRRKIEARFSISDLGDLQLYMGCTVSRDRAARTITVDQTVYVKSVCKRYNYHAVGEVPHVPYRRLAGQQETAYVGVDIPYREAVGSLMWAAVMTRLDIANAVREVAKYCNSPKKVHWRAVLSIIAYLQ